MEANEIIERKNIDREEDLERNSEKWMRIKKEGLLSCVKLYENYE